MFGRRTTRNRVSFDAKSGSKTEGTPHAVCWQNQLGYRYHSANFQPGTRCTPCKSLAVHRSTRGLGTKTTQARVSMVCFLGVNSWPPHDGAQTPLGQSQACDSVCFLRAKIHPMA